jgi:ABC-2 type transport system permease protein
MKLRRIKAVFKKQMLNTPHNVGVLIQLLIFPLIIFLTDSIYNIGNSGNMQLVMNLSTMFVGLIPMSIISNIIREDRVSGTFRMMIMSTVKPFEYFIGVNACVLFVSLIDALIFSISAGLSDLRLLIFIMGFMSGIMTTLMLGSVLAVAYVVRVN